MKRARRDRGRRPDGLQAVQDRQKQPSGDKFEGMLAWLKVLDKKQKTEAQHLNQIRDIVIAEPPP